MIDDKTRATMAANLVDFILALEVKAELDSDPVSIEGYMSDGEIVGAVVSIRGSGPTAEFMSWAVERGFLTEGKGIVDGTVSVSVDDP